jgi:hypothetical protein
MAGVTVHLHFRQGRAGEAAHHGALGIDRRRVLGHRFPLLGQIPSEEDAAGRGMLTVIVVHKVGDMQPSPGFFASKKPRQRYQGSSEMLG